MVYQQYATRKGIVIYDFKFDDLSTIAYNHLLKHNNKYKIAPKFYVINFDGPRRSHRCTPLNPEFMMDISDAYEAAYNIMVNLNKSWILKLGDFFVENPIVLLAAIIWFFEFTIMVALRISARHRIAQQKYSDVFTILKSYPEVENNLSPLWMPGWGAHKTSYRDKSHRQKYLCQE